MSSQRVALIAAVFAAVAISLAAAIPNNLIVGKRAAGDSLVHSERIEKDANRISEIVTVTKTFQSARPWTITQIRAVDEITNGRGGTAQIVAGGVGYKYAIMKFENKKFPTLEFLVEIYGKA